jgi:hypothetical protein
VREIRIVWAVVAALLVAVLVTYARLDHLYHVTESGVRGGLGRVVVELNYPVAIVALGVLGVVTPYLARSRRPVAALAAVLCLVVVVPGVVKQSDLDVRWVNAVPALGVGLAAALSLSVVLSSERHSRGDPLRVVFGVVLVLLATPWIAALLGFYLDGVPVLGSIFETGKLVSYHGDAAHHAVHHGVHHGLDGLVVAASALLLSRLPNRVSPYLALMLAYGVADIANDDWLEQIAERGWTSWTIPGSIQPALNWTWLGVAVATTLIWLLWFRQPEREAVDPRAVTLS